MANCCAKLTNTYSTGCCDDPCPKKVYIQIKLKSLTGLPLCDLDSRATLAEGIVDCIYALDANCSFESCNLTANTRIGPLATDGSPLTYYTLCQTVDGKQVPDIDFVIDESHCGTVVHIKDVQQDSIVPGTGVCVCTGGGGGTVECCNTSAVLSGNVLTINQSNGSSINVDLSTLAGGVDTVTTLVNNGDNTYTYTNEAGEQTLVVDCCNTAASLSGTVLTVNQSNGNPISVDLASLAGGGGGTECCNTAASLSGNILTISQSNGTPVSVDLSALAGATECCNTGLSLTGTTLTITQSNGSPLSVDLSSLGGGGGGDIECCNTSASLTGTMLTINQSNGSPVMVDLAAVNTDCCNTGFSLSGNILTLSQSDGSPISVDLSSLAGTGGVECCNTSASIAGTTLTINQSNGSPVTVDLASLQSEECCNTGLTIDPNSGVMTLTQSNGATLTATIPDGGVNTVECCNTALTFDDATDVLTLTQSNGPTLTATIPNSATGAGCAVGSAACPNGSVGCQVGCYIFASAPIDAGGNSTNNSKWLEENFPAAGFCEFWVQCVINATGGQSEDWIVLADATGNLQWHQRS